MLQETIKVRIKNGADARILAELVQVANYYPCSIYLAKGEKRINAKSIMGMMGIGILEGDEIVVVTDGEREADAMESIRQFMKD
ncbi:MAG: HPr family phosphocarrier protein [Lachnospiraceae bacterium]|nr:HPr family phosphocarrier protein [Lachnospiraceae bacterium]